jgi:uncharacterized protein (TIGR00251 family)
LKVRVAAPAEKGKANQVLVELLRDWLGAIDVEIVAGLSRREKTIRVKGTVPDALKNLTPDT